MEEAEGIKEVINGHEEKNIKEEIFTKVVRAGKRTYFFDVKATRKDDYYLTITEKHKIFLYKEDFEKFTEGLRDAVTYIDNGKDEIKTPEMSSDIESPAEKSNFTAEEFTNVEFEDLGKK
jgi:hypothetical protein